MSAKSWGNMSAQKCYHLVTLVEKNCRSLCGYSKRCFCTTVKAIVSEWFTGNNWLTKVYLKNVYKNGACICMQIPIINEIMQFSILPCFWCWIKFYNSWRCSASTYYSLSYKAFICDVYHVHFVGDILSHLNKSVWTPRWITTRL